MVDLSKIRPGDEVTVRAVVSEHRYAENWGLHFQHVTGLYDGRARHYVHPDCIVSHTPKALAVGDRVRDGAHPTATKATVLFADDRDVVIRTDEGGIHSGPVDGDWVKRLERAHD